MKTQSYLLLKADFVQSMACQSVDLKLLKNWYALGYFNSSQQKCIYKQFLNIYGATLKSH